MRLKIFGIGAAGNKAVINMLEKQFVDKRDIVLINSTIRDIPQEYRELAIRLSDTVKGCGQERKLAQNICLDAIKSGRLNLDAIIDPEYDKAIIITSTNGGTGSGASTIIAKYLKEVVGIEVEIIGLVGFDDESARALRNLIEFCQDLSDEYAIQLIRNSAYLQRCRGNRSAAELEVNDEVARRIMVMSGILLKDSAQNIDDTDIMKSNNLHGYKSVEYIEVYEKIKNMQQFNDILTEIVDESPSMDNESKKIGILAVMMNLAPTSQAFVDRSFSILKEKYGEPYEVYTHVEYVEDYPQFIAVIASGMKMPLEAIEEAYERYEEMNTNVDKQKDNFFETINGLRGSLDDSMFDAFSQGGIGHGNSLEAKKNNFFAEFDMSPSSPKKGGNNKSSNNNNNGF